MSHQQWTAETGGWSAALSGLQLWFTHSNQSIWQPSSCWGLRESWGCHRPPSLPSTSCSSSQSSAMDKSPCWDELAPTACNQHFCFHVPCEQLIPKSFGFAQFTRDLFRPRCFLRFVSWNGKWASLGFPVSRVIVNLVYLFVSWIMWLFFNPP